MPGQKIVFDTLNSSGIPYQIVEHEAVYTVEDIDKLNLSEKGGILKNLFLRDAKGKRHFLVCAMEDKPINLKELKVKLGTLNLSFASEERLMDHLGLRPGSVSPFGVLNDEARAVTVVFDSGLEGRQSLGVHPNENTATLFLAFDDIKRVVREHGNPILVLEL